MGHTGRARRECPVVLSFADELGWFSVAARRDKKSRMGVNPLVTTSPRRPVVPRGEAIQCLQACNRWLRTVGYNADALRERFGVRHADELHVTDRLSWSIRLRAQEDSMAIALRLFWLEDVVPRALAEAHAGSFVAPALRLGLLQRRGQAVESCLRVEPVEELLIWADRRFESPLPSRLVQHGGGPVYPPSFDSLLLAELLPVAAGQEVLDLCTGSGVLALIAARRGAKVWAVDVDPRAVELASLNAAANRLRLVVIEGNLYAPVGSRSFDVIVANPPFVCSPYNRGPRYHSGGPTGDAVLARVVRGWRRHLRFQGRALTIGHVGLREGESLLERAQRWLRGFDGRCLLVELDRSDAVAYATTQAAFALAEGLESYEREVQRWLRHLRRHRVHEVVAFLLVAERSGTAAVEMASAKPVVVPVPLNRSATQVVQEWWAT